MDDEVAAASTGPSEPRELQTEEHDVLVGEPVHLRPEEYQAEFVLHFVKKVTKATQWFTLLEP